MNVFDFVILVNFVVVIIGCLGAIASSVKHATYWSVGCYILGWLSCGGREM
jgi:hypothetical protein